MDLQFDTKQGGGPPPGFYKTKFVTVEATEHEEYGAGLKFCFEVIDGEHKGETATRITSSSPTPKNVAGRMISGISGETLTPGKRVDLAPFVGRDYLTQVKQKGKVVGTQEVLADPGVDDKRLLVVEPEFAAVLRVCRRETNTLSAVLRCGWDSGMLRTLAKNTPAVATDAHVSIIGHITSEELRRALAEVEGFNGFCNRFLWLAVRRSKLLPDGGRDLDLTILAQRLALASEQARSVDRMHRDAGAAALWRRTYAELADDQAGGLLEPSGRIDRTRQPERVRRPPGVHRFCDQRRRHGKTDGVPTAPGRRREPNGSLRHRRRSYPSCTPSWKRYAKNGTRYSGS